MENTKQKSVNFSFPIFLLFFSKLIIYLIGFTVFFAGIVFLSGANVKDFQYVFLFISLLTILFIGWEFKRFFKQRYTQIALFTLFSSIILLASTLSVTKIYDKSWDGMTYHQIAIIKLAEGWNPVYESLPYEQQDSKYFDRKIVMNLWVNHYAKASEIFAAIMMGITSSIESGKVFNLMLLFAAFCSVFHLLLSHRRIKPLWSFFIAAAAAFNPISVNQVFSYYIDGAIASLLVILICQFILIYQNDTLKNSILPASFTIFFVITILVNLKFTGLVYAGLFSVFFLIFLLIVKKTVLVKQSLAVLIPSGLLAVLVTGFNPYITNSLSHGHPFHPLAGKNKTDIIGTNIPLPLIESNTFEKLIISTFSRSENFDNRKEDEQIKLKIPFTFDYAEIKAFQSEGIRLGGFGVFWSGILLVSVALFFICLYLIRGRERIYLLAFCGAVILSVAINPESWWARYIPQFWLFPVILSVFILYFVKSTRLQIASKLLMALLILNSLIVFSAYSYSAIKTTSNANKEFLKLKTAGVPVKVYLDIFTSNQQKLKDNQIPFLLIKNADEMSCSRTLKILKMEFCVSE